MVGEWNTLGIVFSFLVVFLFARSLLYKCVQVSAKSVRYYMYFCNLDCLKSLETVKNDRCYIQSLY